MKNMRRCYNDHQKSNMAHLRTISSLEHDYFPYIDEYDASHRHHSEFQDMEMQLLLHALAEKVSQQQMTIVRMRTEGYALREIARAQNLSLYFVRKLLEEVRMVLTQLCEE